MSTITVKDGMTVALLHHRTSRKAAPFLYDYGCGKTVTPWPDPTTALEFLPLRQDSGRKGMHTQGSWVFAISPACPW